MRRGAGTALGETDGRRLRFKGAAAESTVASAIASVSVTAAIRPGERVARPRPETGFAAARSSQRARALSAARSGVDHIAFGFTAAGPKGGRFH